MTLRRHFFVLAALAFASQPAFAFMQDKMGKDDFGVAACIVTKLGVKAGDAEDDAHFYWRTINLEFKNPNGTTHKDIAIDDEKITYEYYDITRRPRVQRNRIFIELVPSNKGLRVKEFGEIMKNGVWNKNIQNISSKARDDINKTLGATAKCLQKRDRAVLKLRPYQSIQEHKL